MTHAERALGASCFCCPLPDEWLACTHPVAGLNEHRSDGAGDFDGDTAGGAGAYTAAGCDLEDQIAVASFLGDDGEAYVGRSRFTVCRGFGGIGAVHGRFSSGFCRAAGGEHAAERQQADSAMQIDNCAGR